MCLVHCLKLISQGLFFLLRVLFCGTFLHPAHTVCVLYVGVLFTLPAKSWQQVSALFLLWCVPNFYDVPDAWWRSPPLLCSYLTGIDNASVTRCVSWTHAKRDVFKSARIASATHISLKGSGSWNFDRYIIMKTSVVVRCCWQERARSCLRYLVSQLANMEHSFHHILLLEIKSITDAFSSILGPHSRDIFRMSNSFTNIAKLLSRQLENGRAGNGRYL